MIFKNLTQKEITLYVIIILELIIGILLLTRNLSSKKTSEYVKNQLDSLKTINVELEKKIELLDNTAVIYENKIEELEFKIDNVKEKTTIIKEYYKEQRYNASKYTQTQLDSFFKTRYNF